MQRRLDSCWGDQEATELAREALRLLDGGRDNGVAGQAALASYGLLAGDYERARIAAEKLLDAASGHDVDYARRVAHSVLGVLALRGADLLAAERHLLETLTSPPGKHPRSSLCILTRTLWKMGRHASVAHYLAGCRSRWAASESEDWVAAMSESFPEFLSIAEKILARPATPSPVRKLP